MIRIFRVHALQNTLPAFWVSDSVSLWKDRMVSNFQWGIPFPDAQRRMSAHISSDSFLAFSPRHVLESEKDNLGGSLVSRFPQHSLFYRNTFIRGCSIFHTL